MAEGLPIYGQCELIKDWQDARYYRAFTDTWYPSMRGRVLDILYEDSLMSNCTPVFGWSEQVDGKVIKRMIAYRDSQGWGGQKEWWVFNISNTTCEEVEPRKALERAWEHIPKDSVSIQYLHDKGLFLYE